MQIECRAALASLCLWECFPPANTRSHAGGRLLLPRRPRSSPREFRGGLTRLITPFTTTPPKKQQKKKTTGPPVPPRKKSGPPSPRFYPPPAPSPPPHNQK